MVENNPLNFNKTKEQFPEIGQELIQMGNEDQQMINEAQKKDHVWGEEHAKHLLRIKEIIDQIGWPTISKVGKEGSHWAWLIVQHADEDKEFQKSCLALMQNEKDGEVSKSNIAYLIDRIRANNNEPTLYGTQYEESKDGKGPLLPIEDPENLRDRRESMGLPREIEE
jgi:hypothetical protein